MTEAHAPINLNPQIVLTQAQYELLLRRVRAADLQKSYVKKYHLSEKGRIAKRKAQRKYRQRKRAERLALAASVEVPIIDITEHLLSTGDATIVLNE